MMRLRIVSKWLLIAMALIVSVRAANAEGYCRCGTDTREYQILKTDKGTAVRVWVFNYCPVPSYVLVNVVATAADDGALLRSDKPLRVNPWQRLPVDVPFGEAITIVNYWFATRLGGTQVPL